MNAKWCTNEQLNSVLGVRQAEVLQPTGLTEDSDLWFWFMRSKVETACHTLTVPWLQTTNNEIDGLDNFFKQPTSNSAVHTWTMTFDPSTNPGLTGDESDLIQNVVEFTKHYFEDPRFDASHDFAHVLRVTAIACKLLEQENKVSLSTNGVLRYSPLIVILGALLHDVDDKKYINSPAAQMPAAKQKLLQLNVSPDLASKVQTLIEGVSFSSEKKNPQRVRDILVTIPELAVVQDADRLDAMGAVGIGRCFVYGALKGERHMSGSIEHFDEKLLKLESMMKTPTGSTLARKYSDRLKIFKSWWADELDFAS